MKRTPDFAQPSLLIQRLCMIESFRICLNDGFEVRVDLADV